MNQKKWKVARIDPKDRTETLGSDFVSIEARARDRQGERCEPMKPEEAIDLLRAHPKAWTSMRNGETRECRTADELREALEEGERRWRTDPAASRSR